LERQAQELARLQAEVATMVKMINHFNKVAVIRADS
jgi:hypothetical protein